MLLVLAVGGFATSCSEDDVDKGPAEGINGNGVYFPADSPAVVYIVEGQTKVEVPLVRMNDTGEFSISILGSVGKDTPEIFTFQEYANFAAGSKETTVTVTFSASDIEVGKSYEVILLLGDDDNISLYGMKEYTFSMMIDPYVDIEGEGTFNDWFLFAETYKVKIRRHSKNPNAYRVMEPWTEGLIAEGLADAGLGVANPAPYFDFVVDPATGLVTYDWVVYPLNYAAVGACDDLIMMHPSALRYGDGSTPDVTYNCQLMEGVFQIAPFIFDSDYHGWEFFQDPIIYICLPGCVNLQPIMAAEYKGIFTDPEGDSEAVFEVQTNGDVSTYMWTVVEGDLSEDMEAANAALEAMLAGEDPNAMEEIGAEATGGIELTYPMDTPGSYTALFMPMASNSGEKVYGSPIMLPFEFSNGSGVAPADFTAQIELSDLAYNGVTLSITPAADNLRYYYGILLKTAWDAIPTSSFGSVDKYLLSTWEAAAKENKMELAEFMTAAKLISKGPVEDSSFQGYLEAETDYVAFAYCIDTQTFLARSECSVVEFKTLEMPEMEANYAAWLGTWSVTSSEKTTFDIEITPKNINQTYNLVGWSSFVAYGQVLGETIPMTAQYTEEKNLGLTSEYFFDVEASGLVLSLCSVYLTEGNSVIASAIDKGIAFLEAVLGDDATSATIEPTPVEFNDGSTDKVIALEILGIDFNAGKFYTLLQNQVDLTAPFTLTKKAAASTSSVNKPMADELVMVRIKGNKALSANPRTVRRNLIASTNHVMVR